MWTFISPLTDISQVIVRRPHVSPHSANRLVYQTLVTGDGSVSDQNHFCWTTLYFMARWTLSVWSVKFLISADNESMYFKNLISVANPSKTKTQEGKMVRALFTGGVVHGDLERSVGEQ